MEKRDWSTAAEFEAIGSVGNMYTKFAQNEKKRLLKIPHRKLLTCKILQLHLAGQNAGD